MKNEIEDFAQRNGVSVGFTERTFFDDSHSVSNTGGNELTVESGWKVGGRITANQDGILQLPQNIPEQPGLYKLVFSPEQIYLGEAGDIRRRLGDYLVYYAATGIESELRINRALHKAGGADIYYYVGNNVTSRSHRCKIEARLVSEARGSYKSVLNGGTVTDKIAFHAAEIVRLSKQLQGEVSDE